MNRNLKFQNILTLETKVEKVKVVKQNNTRTIFEIILDLTKKQ